LVAIPRYKVFIELKVKMGLGLFHAGAWCSAGREKRATAHGRPRRRRHAADPAEVQVVREGEAAPPHLELFGPCPSTAVDDEPHTGLAAGVYEDVGDKLIRGARSSARDAYRRAANAQRAFAGYARSEHESAARVAEADRIEGKARG
jgi:hypothetical protein